MHRLYNLFLLVSCLLGAVIAKKKAKTKPYQYDTSKYANLCTSYTIPKHQHKTLQWLLQASGASTVNNKESAQNKAACFILVKDKKRSKANSLALKQRYALAVLYYMTQGDTKWEERDSWLSTSKSECSWMGIQCNMRGHIVGLDLGFNNLTGLFPRELKLLTKMRDVDLHGNELQGVIPNSVLEAWTGVEYLRLHMNGFFGQLPREISKLKNLKELHLFGNYFQGSIPTELAQLPKLEALDIYANNFAGTVPAVLGKMKKLREFDCHDNDLTGQIPSSFQGKHMDLLAADCLAKPPEVRCDFCTVCCEGLPKMRCVDMKTKREIIIGQ